uniref:Uncharacterized protein n=1 Tax=Noctiluca scintillans TaxID=2966 RepID=A0A7S1AQA9_NOCSC
MDHTSPGHSASLGLDGITSGMSNTIPAIQGFSNALGELSVVVQGKMLGFDAPVQEIFDSADVVSLKESVWDVALFVFYTPLGKGTNFAVMAPLLLTIFLQVSLTCVVVLFIKSADEEPPDLIDQFTRWRASASPDMISAVCYEDWSFATSFRQQQAFDTYSTYTENVFGQQYGLHSAGPTTCFLVCITWTLTVLKVLGGVMDKALGVYHLTHMKSTDMELQAFETERSSGVRILTIPPKRAAWFFCIALGEVAIGFLLLIAGIQWLVATEGISDLLLNSVALGYIMDLDELIYCVLTPTKCCTMLQVMEPLPMHWPIIVPVRNLVLTFVGIPSVAVALFLINRELNDLIVLIETLCPYEL